MSTYGVCKSPRFLFKVQVCRLDSSLLHWIILNSCQIHVVSCRFPSSTGHTLLGSVLARMADRSQPSCWLPSQVAGPVGYCGKYRDPALERLQKRSEKPESRGSVYIDWLVKCVLLQMSQRMQESLPPRHLVLSCPASSENFVSDCCMEPFHSWSFTLPLCEYRPYLQASLCEQRGHALKTLQVEARSRSITICSTLLRPVMLCSRNCRKIWNANAIMTYIWHIMVPFGAIMCHRNDMPLVAISICHQGSAESSTGHDPALLPARTTPMAVRAVRVSIPSMSKHAQTILRALQVLQVDLNHVKHVGQRLCSEEIAPLTISNLTFRIFYSLWIFPSCTWCIAALCICVPCLDTVPSKSKALRWAEN